MKAKQILKRIEKKLSQHENSEVFKFFVSELQEDVQEFKIELIRLNETLNYYKDMEQWMEEHSNNSLCDFYNKD